MNRVYGLRLCLLVFLWTLASCSGGGGSADEGNDVPGGGSDVQLDTSLDVVGFDAQNDHSQDGEPSPDQADDHVSTELPPDETPPTVNIIEPKDGAQVSEAATIQVEADDDHGVEKVELALDGQPLVTLTSAPYEYEWEFSDLQTGNYSLSATAYDEAGNSATDEVVVFVKGECDENGDCPPASVTIVTPVEGATVCGQVTIEATATDDNGIAEIEFYVDDDSLGVEIDSPYQKGWDTTAYSNAQHTIKVVVKDTSGYEAFMSHAVVVDNTSIECDNLPNISFESLSDGAYLDGVVEIVANASDDIGVLKVQFFIDNALLEEDNTVPYKIDWDTADFDEGAHTLKAIAYDTAEHTAEIQISVTVDRTPPEIELINPAQDFPYHDLVPLEANATDNFKVEALSFTVDDDDPIILAESPFTTEFDGTNSPSGTYDLTVSAVDGAGHEVQLDTTFKLDRPPLVSFDEPGDGEMVYGEFEILVEATDDLGIADVTLLVDGDSLAESGNGPGGNLHMFMWDTPYEKGEHELKATVEDSSGQVAEAIIGVLVDHPVEVDLLLCEGQDCNPLLEDTELSGIVSLSAEAQDDGSDIATVEFYVDGNLEAVDSSAPFEFDWDSALVADGIHTLKVLAKNVLDETGEDVVDSIINNCDLDDDGYLDMICGGTDCDDSNPNFNPSEYDGVGNQIDENCDGVDGTDDDGDGYASEESGGEDCDDELLDIHPCADDITGDGVDSNCDEEDALSCDDCNACTTDDFDGLECQHMPVEEGQSCEDSDLCTTGGTCQEGLCQGAQLVSCDDDSPCTDDSCVPSMGCKYIPNLQINFQPCADGFCVDGECCAFTCEGKECGADGCGNVCGNCIDGEVCGDDLMCYGDCLSLYQAHVFSDSLQKIDYMAYGEGGYPGQGLDLDGDPDTCTPQSDCSDGIDNGWGALHPQLTVLFPVSVNDAIATSLQTGEPLSGGVFGGLLTPLPFDLPFGLVEFVSPSFNGDSFVLNLYDAQPVEPKSACDFQDELCDYTVTMESFVPFSCVPVSQFNNATIVDGQLTAGGTDQIIWDQKSLGDGLVLIHMLQMVTLKADIVMGEGNQFHLENGVVGYAIRKDILLDSVYNLPDSNELPISPQLLWGLMDMIIIADFDSDGDGEDDSVSVGVQFNTIPANITGVIE